MSRRKPLKDDKWRVVVYCDHTDAHADRPRTDIDKLETTRHRLAEPLAVDQYPHESAHGFTSPRKFVDRAGG